MKQQLDQRADFDASLVSSALSGHLLQIGQISNKVKRDTALLTFTTQVTERIKYIVEEIAKGGLSDDDSIVTTNDEIDTFLLVQGILRDSIEPHRVTFRGARSYTSVFVDDNKRKPICRFHFNGRAKHIGTFDQYKRETKHLIQDTSDLFDLAPLLKSTAQRYM